MLYLPFPQCSTYPPRIFCSSGLHEQPFSSARSLLPSLETVVLTVPSWGVHVSVLVSESDSNTPHTRPFNIVGTRSNILPLFDSLVAAQTSNCLNHNLSSLWRGSNRVIAFHGIVGFGINHPIWHDGLLILQHVSILTPISTIDSSTLIKRLRACIQPFRS